MPDRHELGHARLVLILEDPDRVRTVAGRHPLAVRLQRHRLALGAPLRLALLDRLREVEHAAGVLLGFPVFFAFSCFAMCRRSQLTC